MSAHERTGWRDKELSGRHRTWGMNCPACDLDFLMVEYNLGKPAALVEYKHHLAARPDIKHPTYRAIIDLADGYRSGPLPALIAFYWPDVWAFKVQPLNEIARKWFTADEIVSEREFVTRLYRIRGWRVNEEVLKRLRVDCGVPTLVVPA